METVRKARLILERDILIIAVSILATLLLVQAGLVENFISLFQGAGALGAFVSGIFFTSFFTIAFSTISFARLSELFDPALIALWGALSAMVGDFILFLFMRDFIAEDILKVFKKSHIRKVFSAHHWGFMRWVLPLIGALTIASPLPDELGIALLGISKTKIKHFLIISFVMNLVGILIVVYISRGIHSVG